MSIRLRSLFGIRFWLGLIIALSFVNAGCDTLGIGKEEKKSKKSKDDDDDAKKKKKKKKDDDEDDEDKPKSKASASAAGSGTSDSPTAPVADGSTGLKECDEYLAKFEKTVKPKPEDLQKMRDAFKQGAVHAPDVIKKSCMDGMDALKKLEKDHEISQDDHKRMDSEVQKATDQAITDIDHLLATKEKEIMTV
jgi:hypothetical protein